MERVRSYLMSVVAVAMLSVFLLSFVKKEQLRRILRFVTGLIVLITVLSPLVQIDESTILQAVEDLELSVQLRKEEISDHVDRELARHVKETTEQYIEQKGSELGAIIQAEVQVTEDRYPIPYSVKIIGILTSHQKEELVQYLTLSLGISAERQEWK